MNKIKQVVLSFVVEMNDWEHKMYLLGRREHGQRINHKEDLALIPDAPYEEYKKRYYEIFSKYCTERKRTYGGFPSGWARHGQYKGVAEQTISSVVTPKKNRAEVVAKGGQFPDGEFMFVLIFKDGRWLIDSAKTKHSDDTHWDTHHL
jgi:hypothetical protein